MAEDRRATMRREAAQGALARDEESRFQKVLERAGIVLLPGSAAYKEVLNTLKLYSETTEQSLQQVLSDPVQMSAIIDDPQGLVGYQNLPTNVQGSTLPREDWSLEKGLALRRRQARAKAAKAANERIDLAVHYSQATQSPRLAAYADEVRNPQLKHRDLTSYGSIGRFTQLQGPDTKAAMDAWKKNADPEFLDRLSFIHWTSEPIPLAGGPGNVVDTPLSAAAYLREDPGGMGTLFQKFSNSGHIGFILEGDPVFISNMDVNSSLGEPQGRTTAVLDPVLDESTFMTDTRRAEFTRHLADPPVDIDSDSYKWAPFAGNPGHNEAVIDKPRIVGIVVDPYEHWRDNDLTVNTGRPSITENPLYQRYEDLPERTAVILAEEMNLPLLDPGGRVLLQPEGVSDEQVQRAGRNIPSGENIPRRVTEEELPFLRQRGQESQKAHNIRVQTRNQILRGLSDEISLHEDPNFRISTDTPAGIHGMYGVDVDSPRISREELDTEIERVRRLPDFELTDPENPDQKVRYNQFFGAKDFHPSLAPDPPAEEVAPKVKKNFADFEEYAEAQIAAESAPEVTPRATPEARRSPDPIAEYWEYMASESPDLAEEHAEFLEEQEKVQRLEEEIQDAEQRLADADPGTPESRQVASKLAKAKAALAKLGYLAGVAGTAYEGGRVLGEVGRHGLREGLIRSGGTYAKEAGEVLEVPEMLVGRGLPAQYNPAIALPARALGAAGRGLQRGGRALRGEREETRGVGLDSSVQSLDDMPEMQEFDRELQEILAEPTTAPARLRENAAHRALTSSRKRDEENL